MTLSDRCSVHIYGGWTRRPGKVERYCKRCDHAQTFTEYLQERVDRA